MVQKKTKNNKDEIRLNDLLYDCVKNALKRRKALQIIIAISRVKKR
jgi:hypothetical protein